MVVERGGLRYPIEVLDRFSPNLLKFRDEVAAASAEWLKFRDGARGTGSEVAGVTAAVRSMASAVRESTSATNASAKAHRAKKADLTLEEQGAAALNRELRNLAVAEEADRQAAAAGTQTRRQATKARREAAAAAKEEVAAAKASARAQKEVDDANKATLSRIQEVAAARQKELAAEQAAAEKAAAAKAKADAQDAKLHAAALARIKERFAAEDRARVKNNVEQQAFVDDYRKKLLAAQATERSQGDAVAAKELDARARGLQRVIDYQEKLRQAHIAERKERERAANTAANAANKASKALDSQNFFANRLLFTFRRLVGVLAVFQAARFGASAFSGLISGGIRFNQTLETSQLGIAGILTSVSNIADVQTGEMLTGAEKYAAAMGIAKEQQQKLRQDALSTVATYQELLDVFQVALGPGLAEGLQVDQIREVAVLVSQAASSLGVAQNQLSEEVRSLLTGNIRVTTSRIAQALNLTPEDVRNAKATGTQYELLTERLSGFAIAAKGAANTVGGLFVRLKDVFELITGSAAAKLFEDLRNTLQGLFDSLTVTEKTKFGDLLKPNPEVQAAFEEIYDALRRVLVVVGELGADIGPGGLQKFLSGVAVAIEVVGRVGASVISGLVTGFGILAVALTPVQLAIENLRALIDGAFGPRAFEKAISGLVAMVVLFVSMQAIVTGVVGLVAKIGPQFLIAAKAAGVVTGHLLNWRVALVVGIIAMNELLKKVLGIEVTIADWPELIGTAIELMATKLFANIDLVVTKLRVSIVKTLKRLVVDAEYYGKKFISFVDFVGGADTRTDLEAQRQNALKALVKEYQTLDLEVKEAAKTDEQTSADAEARAAQRLNDLEQEIQKRAELADIPLANITTPGAENFDVVGKSNPPPTKDLRQLEVDRARVAALTAQVDVQERMAALTAARASADEVALAAAREQLGLITIESEARQAVLDSRRQELQESLAGERNEQAKALLLEKIKLTDQEIVDEKRAQNAALTEQIELVRQLDLAANGDAIDGFGQGLLNFGNEFASRFKAGINIATTALNGFVNTVSSAIVDAFDPTVEEKSILERFGQLLKEIAKVIIAELLKIAIAKAIVSGAAKGASSTAGIGFDIPSGFHKGGPVRSARRARPSLAHYRNPVGRAAGGSFPRPRGLHPTDTLPIWVNAEEWVIRAKSTRKYGDRAMAAINEGLIDPSALNALVSATGGRPRVRRPKIGFNTGGSTAAAAAVSASTGGGGGTTLVQPTLVASEATMDTLISGGRNALLRFMRDNADSVGINQTRRS